VRAQPDVQPTNCRHEKRTSLALEVECEQARLAVALAADAEIVGRVNSQSTGVEDMGINDGVS